MAQKKKNLTDVTKAFVLLRKHIKGVCCFKGGDSQFVAQTTNSDWLMETTSDQSKTSCFSFPFINIFLAHHHSN